MISAFPGASDWMQRAAELEALGLTRLEHGRYDDAARLLLDALALHEAHGDDDGALPVATYLGAALYEGGKLEQAVAIWEEVVARGWKLPTVYALLERHYEREGRIGAVARIRDAARRAGPRAAAASRRATAAGAVRSDGAADGHRLLIADDEAGVSDLVVRFLSGIGYHAEAAGDGAVALDAILRGDVDLVILDVFMPKMSGLDILLHMREEGIGTPVIVVSGHPESELVDAVLQHGAVFLAKPLSLKELRRLVEGKLALVDAGVC